MSMDLKTALLYYMAKLAKGETLEDAEKKEVLRYLPHVKLPEDVMTVVILACAKHKLFGGKVEPQ